MKMIKNNNNVVVKIYYNGKQIQKVFQNLIQLYPEQSTTPDTGDTFWIKVTDTSDNKTYYYLCTKSSVVYDTEDTSKITEITYNTNKRQETKPSDNKKIYEIINDNVTITGQDYEQNDFENFEGKSQNEVIQMTRTYRENMLDNSSYIPGFQLLDTIYTSDGAITYTIINKSEVDTSKFPNISDIPDDYTFCYSDYTQDKDYKLYQVILQNISGTKQNFYYSTAGQYEGFTYAISCVTDDLETVKKYVKQGDLVNNIPTDSNWTNNKNITRGTLYTIPVNNNQYIIFYIVLRVKSSGETFYNIFAYKNKSFNIISGNILTHKYISEDILTKNVKGFTYNYSLVCVMNDMNKIVYQTNCKYIISKEENKAVECQYALALLKNNAPGWKLLDRDEWIKYMPYNTDYKMYLTVAEVTATGNEFFGLLDKSSDSYDFRVFAYGNDFYVDPGISRWSCTPKKLSYMTTFTFDGTTNTFNIWQSNNQLGPWSSVSSDYNGFTNNNSTLYLNAYGNEQDYIDESFYFYEFKIEDKNGTVIKRIVPSDNPSKLYECVSNTYIEPCRPNKDNGAIISDLLKIGLKQYDGMGNVMEPYYIYKE